MPPRPAWAGSRCRRSSEYLSRSAVLLVRRLFVTATSTSGQTGQHESGENNKPRTSRPLPICRTRCHRSGRPSARLPRVPGTFNDRHERLFHHRDEETRRKTNLGSKLAEMSATQARAPVLRGPTRKKLSFHLDLIARGWSSRSPAQPPHAWAWEPSHA